MREKVRISRPQGGRVTSQMGKSLRETAKRLGQQWQHRAAEARKHGHIHVGLLELALGTIAFYLLQREMERAIRHRCATKFFLLPVHHSLAVQVEIS